MAYYYKTTWRRLSSLRLVSDFCRVLSPHARGSTLCPGLCHCSTLAWVFLSLQNALTLSTCACWNPSKLWPNFISLLILSWFLCHMLSCTFDVPLMHPFYSPCHIVKEILAFPLHFLSPPPGWVRCIRDCHSQCCSLQKVLHSVCWMELFAAGVQGMSVMISGAPERKYSTPWWRSGAPLKVRLSFHFKQLPKGVISFQLSWKYLNLWSSILTIKIWDVLYWSIYCLFKKIYQP